MSCKLTFPSISVVIIGLNASVHIQSCIESVFACNYPQEQIEIIYVDGGSSDQSVALAKVYDQVKVIELNSDRPSPGKGRNVGLSYASHNYVQFLDSDTQLDSNWLAQAVGILKNSEIASVSGNLDEVFPEKNFYHRVANLEWCNKTYEGYSQTFGGIVLVKKNLVEELGGYDENTHVGEDPDLSFRMHLKGYRHYELAIPMVEHDINMTSFKRYMKRCIRSGYGYALLGLRYRHTKEKLWFDKLLKRILRVFLVLFIASITYFIYPSLAFVLFFLLSFKDTILWFRWKKRYQLSVSRSIEYGFHLDLANFFQFIGISHYFFRNV